MHILIEIALNRFSAFLLLLLPLLLATRMHFGGKKGKKKILLGVAHKSNTLLCGKVRHKSAHTYTQYICTSWRLSLVMSDCRAQDDSSMKTFPPASTTIGCDSGYIKTIFFPSSSCHQHPSPHPPLKPAPTAHKEKEGAAR